MNRRSRPRAWARSAATGCALRAQGEEVVGVGGRSRFGEGGGNPTAAAAARDGGRSRCRARARKAAAGRAWWARGGGGAQVDGDWPEGGGNPKATNGNTWGREGASGRPSGKTM
jgi:hypothetical protein